MQRRTCVVADTDEQYKSTAIVESGKRRVLAEGNVKRVTPNEEFGVRPHGGKGIGRVFAASYLWPGSKQLRYGAHSPRGRAQGIVGRHGGADHVPPFFWHGRSAPLSRVAQCAGLCWHHERAVCPNSIQQCLD